MRIFRNIPFKGWTLTLFASLTVIATLLYFSSCQNEELILPTHSKKFIQKKFDDPLEQLFFKLDNQQEILNEFAILPRSGEIPEILIDVYNEVILANEQDSFAYNVALRIGFPLWLKSKLELSGDSIADIIYIPFSFQDTNEISGYLVGFKDYTLTNPVLKLDIRMRTDIDSIRDGLKPYTPNTCHELLRFMAFDSVLYQRPTIDYDSMVVEGCLPNSLTYTNNQIETRSCTSEIVTMCMWIDNGDGLGDDGGGYVDWEYENNDPNKYIMPNGPPLNAGPWGGGITISTIWFTWWTVSPIKKKIGMTFTDPNQIESRTLVEVCSDFLVIRCLNGTWWEEVAKIPCDGCDEEYEELKAQRVWCRQAGIDFATAYAITDTIERKIAMMASNACCKDFYLDEACTKQAFLERIIGCEFITLDGRIDHLMDEHPEDIEWIQNFIEERGCNPETGTFIETVIGLRMEDSLIRTDRCVELFDIVRNDPSQLIANCFDENDPEDYEFWSELATFVPNQSILDKIEDDGYSVQFIEDALAARVNLDYYVIQLNIMPKKANGQRMTNEELIAFFRLNINDYSNFGSGGSIFTPIDNDVSLWNSTNPLGSIIEIDIPFNNGVVACTDYSSCCWIFSTLKDGYFITGEGWHPVSGNRQFGIAQNGNNKYFYLKGADRASAWHQALVAPIVYGGTDALWSNVVDRFNDWITNPTQDGSTIKATPITHRPNWNAIKNILKLNDVINHIPCD